MRRQGLIEPHQLSQAHLNWRKLVGSDVLRYQQGEANHQLRSNQRTDSRLVVTPVEYSLRVQRCVLGVAEMEHSVPGDEDIVKEDHGVEFVATGSEWMLHVRFLDGAFSTYERDTGCVGRQCRVGDLLAHNPGTEERSEERRVGKECVSTGKYRLL